jgi:glycosyltransferase involved in cell wall biosynthesis
MKILFDHPEPALLAHGGMQIQIRQTKAALEGLGCEVEYLRWWDDTQTGDIIHNFARMAPHLVELAHQKGIQVVLSELLTVQGSRSRKRLWCQRAVMRAFFRLLPSSILVPFRWRTYRLADACIALTAWEAHLFTYVFGVPAARVHVVPNGVEREFLDSQPSERGKWLVCTATITPRKRVVELARAAALARTPVWIIGKPFGPIDVYADQLIRIATESPEYVRYEGAVQDRTQLAAIYRRARGFVLWSSAESLSLSALEASACACPLLLSDLPWARSSFGSAASYCPAQANDAQAAAMLRAFYDAAPKLQTPPRPLTWPQIAQQLVGVYQKLLTSRRPI